MLLGYAYGYFLFAVPRRLSVRFTRRTSCHVYAYIHDVQLTIGYISRANLTSEISEPEACHGCFGTEYRDLKELCNSRVAGVSNFAPSLEG